MLKSLSLKNFRSIRRTDIRFSDSGLSVLIGANGSGKSNVVRALEFIAALGSHDLSSAVADQGGQLSLLPKALTRRQFRETVTSMAYDIDIPLPPQYPVHYEPPRARHELDLQWTLDRRFHVAHERLHLTEPLAVVEALKAAAVEMEQENTSAYRRSAVSFRRVGNNVSVKVAPRLTSRNAEAYLSWFGFDLIDDFAKRFTSSRDLNDFFRQINTRLVEQGYRLHPTMSMLDIGARAPFALSAQAGVFRAGLRNIRRFDLHLAELRKEQQALRSKFLSSDGANLPAAVRWVRTQRTEGFNWNRLQRTLRDIAPHVKDLKVNALQTGREYVEFVETTVGRPVESWDASDGTLRALAILIAIETHPPAGTVVIEEPEQGLHPWAVRTLMDHIREVIADRGIQVILTTHSQQVLEEAAPDEVLITTRTLEAGTTVKSVNDAFPEGAISSGELGRLWVKGLLGGVPSRQEITSA